MAKLVQDLQANVSRLLALAKSLVIDEVGANVLLAAAPSVRPKTSRRKAAK